ncbi:hypothetical protein K8353_47720, partial [Burkholderia contaminans]|nr:hypothetical protein [Burkholderia contaminans]
MAQHPVFYNFFLSLLFLTPFILFYLHFKVVVHIPRNVYKRLNNSFKLIYYFNILINATLKGLGAHLERKEEKCFEILTMQIF